MALRWKISLAFSLLAAVVLACLWAYLRSAVLRYTTDSIRDGLLAQTRLAAEALPPPWQLDASTQQTVQDLDERSGARVTLIAPDGTVLGDSRHDPATMENHADRPERLEALNRGWGSAVRHSNTLGLDMLYVALAMPEQAGQPAILRMALPLTAVREASLRLRHAFLAAFVAAVALVWLVSMRVAGTLTAPVQRLVNVAHRIGRGDLQARVLEPAPGELAELTEVFNATAEALAGLVASSEREARYYAAILEQMSDAVVVVDERDRVRFINATFSRLFGVEDENVADRYLTQIARSYDLSVLVTRALEQGTAQREEVRVSHPETRILAAAVTPLVGPQDQTIGAVALLRDVTRLRQMDEVRRDFVANASHELRTPVTGIKVLAEAMQSGALQDPEKGPRFLRQILDATNHLARLLDDMLTLTRVERGPEFINAQPVDAAEALAEAVAHVEPTATAKGVNLRTQAGEDDVVHADAASLQTVLMNLLDNAVRHTPPEGEVVLSGQGVADGYEIRVADTGSGIPPEHVPRIFERFYRVDPGRGRDTGGTGLGLAIVKHIADAHGGRVSVRSTPGGGSTFSVFFPAP